MKIEFFVNTHKQSEIIDITQNITKEISESKIKDGICVVYVPHTTSCVCINENADKSVKDDILSTLNQLIPRNGNYTHAEGNSDAHLKSSLIGSSRILIIDEGKLFLGTWQGIYFCEFDGPRKRKVALKLIGS